MITNIFKSRTIWFNALSILLEVGSGLSQTLPPGTALVVVNAVNIILRLITTSNLFESTGEKT